MRNLATSFTMRRDGVLPRGDWFRIENKAAKSESDIYIYDEIGFWGTDASDFVKQLSELDADVFNVHINSPGGEIFDGLAIYNTLKQHKATVNIFVDGLAASAASFIAQAGDKVVMARNAQMMIHDGIAMAYGNEEDMLETAKLLSTLSNNIADIYHQASKRRGVEENSTEYFRSLMRAELWMNGAEAVEFGLADEMTDADDEEAEAAKNKWDLSFYNSAGREKAKSPSRVAAEVAMATQEKEKDMGNTPPKATTDPEVTPAPVPDTTPPVEPQVTGDPEEPGTEAVPQDPPNQEPTETVTTTTPANRTGQQGVLINGKLETDWAVINRHFAILNQAQVEQQATHRKNFVEGLAASNKIAATQVDSLVNLVNGDDESAPMSDEQFARFQASYESAAPSSLFNHHATSTEANRLPDNTGGSATVLNADERKNRISVLEGVVAMQARTMTPENAKQTPSYIELQSLLANNQS